MKKVFQAFVVILGMALLTVTFVQADEAAGTSAATTPAPEASAPAAKAKTKKVKAKKVKTPKKKEAKETWVCPMGDYSGPKTANGKCPTCGMDLVKKTEDKK